MIEYPDNLITRNTFFEGLLKEDHPKVGEWLPFETYDMVQCGYPLPDHGEMILRASFSTDKDGKLLPPKGMWVKAEDVRLFLKLEGLI